MNIIVAEVEKRAKEAAQQLRDAGRDEIVGYAMKAQRQHEAAGMRYAHATLKAVEIMENALNDQGATMNEVQNLQNMTNEELFAARQQADKDLLDDSVDVNEARARSRAIREEMNVRNRQTIKPAKVTPQVEPLQIEDNTQSGLKAGTTNDVWVRDDADADAIMQEIQQTLSDIADERRGQDDEYAKSDADTLYDTSDLVQRIREYVSGKADVTAQTTLDDVASAKPVQAVSEAVSTSEQTIPDYRQWKPASGLKNGRYRVLRYKDGPGLTCEQLRGASDRLRTFGTLEAAKAVADKLNAEQVEAVSTSDDTTDVKPLMRFQTIDADQRTVQVTTHYFQMLWGDAHRPATYRADAERVLNIRLGDNNKTIAVKVERASINDTEPSWLDVHFLSTADASAFYTAMTDLIEWGQTKTAPTKPDSAYKVTVGGNMVHTHLTHKKALYYAKNLRKYHAERVEVVPV